MIETMIGIMTGNVAVVETEIERGTERGIGIGTEIETETVIASETRMITVVIGIEKGITKVEIGREETGTVVVVGVIQGAEVGAGIARIVTAGTNARDMSAVASAPRGGTDLRTMALGRSQRRRKKRRRRRMTGQTIQTQK